MEHAEALTVLGLDGPVDEATVKRTYRRLARELHPDTGGDAERFHRVRVAYETIRRGTSVTTGRPPQAHAAAVDGRWWDAAGRWHEDPVDAAGIDLDVAYPDGTTAADVDLLASLLRRAAPVAPVVLRSRAPGSRLHRIVSWLQPDLLASLAITPAADGLRAGHDVDVVVRATGGPGRRLLAEATTPADWTRAQGSESVRLERRFRPCRVQDDTAVRVSRAVDDLLTSIRWPLGEWFLLRA